MFTSSEETIKKAEQDQGIGIGTLDEAGEKDSNFEGTDDLELFWIEPDTAEKSRWQSAADKASSVWRGIVNFVDGKTFAAAVIPMTASVLSNGAESASVGSTSLPWLTVTITGLNVIPQAAILRAFAKQIREETRKLLGPNAKLPRPVIRIEVLVAGVVVTLLLGGLGGYGYSTFRSLVFSSQAANLKKKKKTPKTDFPQQGTGISRGENRDGKDNFTDHNLP